jgi:RES domain-containing protein
LIVYRLIHPRHSHTAFSGEGAFLAGGRWNSPGVRVVYTSSSVALAVLETLAYRKARKPLTPRHLYRVVLDESQITWLQSSQLPADWMAYPYAESTQAIGDGWVNSGETLALAVPSVLAPQEYNIVLNHTHTDFAHLRIEGPEVFPLNPRLTPDV